MLEVTLTYPTPEGSREIRLDAERTSFGRGSEADYRFADDGLSRLHAVIYRDGDNIWVVDENSTNGTFVNGESVRPGGTPLKNGDTIRIGHNTNLKVRMADVQKPAPKPAAAQTVGAAAPSQSAPINFVPIALIAFAMLIISVSAVFIGFTVFGDSGGEIVRNGDIDNDPANDDDDDLISTPTPIPVNSAVNNDAPDNTGITNSPEGTNTEVDVKLPSGKKYLEMSESEKRQYLEAKAMRVAQIIGNNSSEAIPSAALDKIKSFTDGFAKRINSKGTNGCTTMRPWGDNLQATYERASKNAPFIIRAFNEKGIDSRIGLYLAMIESEHCVCLQSHTGPLGMFQFTFATAKLHFSPNDGVIKGATPARPDVRCQPEPAARAAASYMKALTGRYGTGPSSVPLAIGSYNSGEGGLSSNLQKALDSNEGLPRDFWTLIAKGDILSKQFQSENFKYVPKFFAAAIIGENPQDFGLNLQPVSTYTK